MPQVTIYKDQSVTVEVHDGDPPTDQSAEIAALEKALADMTAERDALQVKIDNAQAALA